MDKLCLLNEDRLPSKLRIVWSSALLKEITDIRDYNQDNPNGFNQWRDYLDGIASYIANPVIAFDYTNRYSRFPNGAIFNRDFNYNVAYVVKTDKYTNQPFVYVFKVNLNPEEFGLKVPSSANESKQCMETIRKAVLPILEFNQRLSMIR